MEPEIPGTEVSESGDQPIERGKYGSDCIELLTQGGIEKYADCRIFDGKIESLDRHIERKSALAQKTRYSILYYLYESGEATRKDLSNATGREGNLLQHHLRDLIKTNLIAKVPAPENEDGRRTYYEITTLGKQEIESDLRNIHNDKKAKNRYRALTHSDEEDGVQIYYHDYTPNRVDEIEESMKEFIDTAGTPNRVRG